MQILNIVYDILKRALEIKKKKKKKNYVVIKLKK